MLVFFALHYLLVRPMWRIIGNMVAFRANPENPSRIIAESGRQDAIGTAEQELGAMQRKLASMLHQCAGGSATGWRRIRCIVAREPAKRAAVSGVAGA